ncbi:multisubunit sodium/proton antiporter MrpA subunit /multisubunit sodium/proton antiporter MrpB subunit [Sediminihabitans luteus]|uniref:Multisubunit sodium/proton antiporter MrpA subunit /multisubunit sodium/proton antiporter MrpB subunit n=1 Tax=Sediminihabitans luteus TaxID=1138585 RepID=A0A2M9D0G9_9CELL|nr:Na+/H+ antiporter subunit A [Sediminihabitans luteus]PJJ77686.1 multisubunit sodium/proton antiporter MrpA subunit /multisubunit sodium/proton antiporter MrpB subunit [Sediminihabitans luteus]GIJ00087.1 Na+/H+ antiporter subunit A [Sediminihabitans luteus]
MLLLLVAHLLMAVAAPALVSWLHRRAFWVLALAPASAFVYALALTPRVMDGDFPEQTVSWVPSIGLELAFRLDTLAWLMLLVVGGVGALVLVYCSAYFSRSATGLRRFAGVLTAFAGSMVGLVTADDLLLLFVFWELTTVFSYLLIGHYAERKAGRRAAMQAIVITTAGGLTMLVGLVILGVSAGTYRVSDVVADPPSGTAVTVAAVLLLVGAATKSALIPFHFWLPAAMAAPTPVSAYLHAAAMVKAGVYLVARFAPAFSDLPEWKAVVIALGGGTLLVGGYRALRQHDLKLVLAFGTVSQLGLIILLVGLGTRGAALAGLAMLGAHAMFKAALFLSVGIVDAATGTRDLRRLTGVGRRLPFTATAAALATLSMIGFPPFAGYVAKEAALESLVHGTGPGWLDATVLWVFVVGSVLTVAYGARFWWGAFATKHAEVSVARANAHVDSTAFDLPAGTQTTRRTRRNALATVGDAEVEPIDPRRIERPSFLLVGPPMILAVMGLLAALLPHVGEQVLGPYAATYPAGEEGHLTLWGGFGPPVVLTLVVFAGGALLFWQRGWVERFQASAWDVPEADRVYRRTMRRLDDLAADVTAWTQRGSLPFYLGAILLVLVVGPGIAGLSGWSGELTVKAWDRPAQLAVVLVVCIAAILATRARRRLKAVLLVGAAGYGNAALFLLHGAPDLAMTQVLVETVTLAVMVLVLRRLPPYFSDRPLVGSRFVRLGIGLAVGLTMMAFAVVAPLARIARPISLDFPAEAYEFGGGKNVVNVTLVDVRAWDTVGEISVLLVAATGVASLVFLSRRSGEIERVRSVRAMPEPPQVWSEPSDGGSALRRRAVRPVPGPDGRTSATTTAVRPWLRAEGTLAPQRRSVIFEVVTRLVFHSMIVFALYLLFSGHNSPGGGFAAGLLVGIALLVRYLAGGRYELGEAAPINPGLLLGTGLFLSAGVGLIALLAGGEVLQSVIVDLHVPLLGDIHLVTSLFFDVGVFLLVVGLVLDILRSLGAEIDRQVEAGGEVL